MAATWTKFTARARNVVFRAEQEATDRSICGIGPGALLLGIIADPTNVASWLLTRIGADVDGLRARALRVLEREHTPVADDTSAHGSADQSQLTRLGRKTIEFANEESEKLGESFLGTEHILLGLCRVAGEIGSDWTDLAVLEPALRAALQQTYLESQAPPQTAPGEIPAKRLPLMETPPGMKGSGPT